jgi:hypothetical protein
VLSQLPVSVVDKSCQHGSLRVPGPTCHSVKLGLVPVQKVASVK